MAFNTYDENAVEMLLGRGRGGGRDPSSVRAFFAASGASKLAARKQRESVERYERGETEDKRRFEIERERFLKLDALKEELSRANLELSQAASGRADVSAEFGRIGSFYPSATTEARRGTREELIGRDLIPESLLPEQMIDPRRDTSRDPYPAAQAGLYPSLSSLPGTRGISTPSRSRIVNAPPGTPSNRWLGGLRNPRVGPSKEFFRQQGTAAKRTAAPAVSSTPNAYSGPYIQRPGVFTRAGGRKTLQQYGY